MESSGEDERDHAGDDRAEDEEQDDQGRGRAEEELAVLEVLLGELREVLVDREVAGDRRLDAGLLVELLDGGDDVRDPVLVDAEADEQRSRAEPSSESSRSSSSGVTTTAAPACRSSSAKASTRAVSTSPESKLTTTTSVVARSAASGEGGKCSATSSSARLESFGDVTSPSVVSASPRSAPTRANATTTATTQSPIVRQG